MAGQFEYLDPGTVLRALSVDYAGPIQAAQKLAFDQSEAIKNRKLDEQRLQLQQSQADKAAQYQALQGLINTKELGMQREKADRESQLFEEEGKPFQPGLLEGLYQSATGEQMPSDLISKLSSIPKRDSRNIFPSIVEGMKNIRAERALQAANDRATKLELFKTNIANDQAERKAVRDENRDALTKEIEAMKDSRQQKYFEHINSLESLRDQYRTESDNRKIDAAKEEAKTKFERDSVFAEYKANKDLILAQRKEIGNQIKEIQRAIADPKLKEQQIVPLMEELKTLKIVPFNEFVPQKTTNGSQKPIDSYFQ